MKSNELRSLPFEFNSPVEFVLVGIQGKRRAVVAKSKGAQIDLVAYAQRDSVDEDDAPYQGTPFSFLFPTPIQLYPVAVDSQPASFPSNQAVDKRVSEFTLVWRGAAYGRHRRKVKEEFATRTEDIVEAVETQSAAQLEWALSSVIDQCHRAYVELRSKRLRYVYAFWFTLLVYIVGIVAYLVVPFN